MIVLKPGQGEIRHVNLRGFFLIIPKTPIWKAG
jgi:hypothetical protein